MGNEVHKLELLDRRYLRIPTTVGRICSRVERCACCWYPAAVVGGGNVPGRASDDRWAHMIRSPIDGLPYHSHCHDAVVAWWRFYLWKHHYSHYIDIDEIALIRLVGVPWWRRVLQLVGIRQLLARIIAWATPPPRPTLGQLAPGPVPELEQCGVRRG